MSPVARGVARFTAMAAVVLLASCGGGSGKKTASTVSVGGGRRVVTAKSGGFRTVVPLGYAYSPCKAQYCAERPQEALTSIVVVREPLRIGDVNAELRRTLRALREQPAIHHVSPIQRLSVDGEPGLALDYAAPEKAGETRVGEVLVGHGEWVYFIRYSSLAARYAVALGAREEVIGSWHWQ